MAKKGICLDCGRHITLASLANMLCGKCLRAKRKQGLLLVKKRYKHKTEVTKDLEVIDYPDNPPNFNIFSELGL